jgi:hypothetical protein
MNLKQSHNPKRSHLTATFAILAAFISLVAAGAAAQALSPSEPVLGRTYGEWSEEWYQWAYSLQVSHHPLFDTADVSAGQRGKVWFLGGYFTGGPRVRNVTIPAGKLLFFPIINAVVDNTDCNGGERISDGLDAPALRSFIKSFMDAAQNLSCTIDGVPVSGLSNPAASPFRTLSPSPNGFSYSIPGLDSINAALGYPCWSNSTGAPIRVDAKTYHPVADGYYLMISALAPGSHTIHLHGESSGLVEDVLYMITVTADDEGD